HDHLHIIVCLIELADDLQDGAAIGAGKSVPEAKCYAARSDVPTAAGQQRAAQRCRRQAGKLTARDHAVGDHGSSASSPAPTPAAAGVSTSPAAGVSARSLAADLPTAGVLTAGVLTAGASAGRVVGVCSSSGMKGSARSFTSPRTSRSTTTR